jgi:hypothetical protein
VALATSEEQEALEEFTVSSQLTTPENHNHMFIHPDSSAKSSVASRPEKVLEEIHAG